VFADNDSQDGVAARVKKIYPSVSLECMKENGGYARSYNILMHAYFKKGFDFYNPPSTQIYINHISYINVAK
jgi:GT2 family glycosyltransferase